MSISPAQPRLKPPPPPPSKKFTLDSAPQRDPMEASPGEARYLRRMPPTDEAGPT